MPPTIPTSRTMLFNIHDLKWIKNLDLLNIPASLLPGYPSSYTFGYTAGLLSLARKYQLLGLLAISSGYLTDCLE